MTICTIIKFINKSKTQNISKLYIKTLYAEKQRFTKKNTKEKLLELVNITLKYKTKIIYKRKFKHKTKINKNHEIYYFQLSFMRCSQRTL